MRTEKEIKERIEKLKNSEEDFFGFQQEVLMQFFPEYFEEGYGHMAIELKRENVKQELVEYLLFAFDKAENHRGISASRSVQKLATYAWILGRDDLVEFASDDSNYPYYGVPILKKFAEEFRVNPPPAIWNWPDGEPCSSHCEEC